MVAWWWRFATAGKWKRSLKPNQRWPLTYTHGGAGERRLGLASEIVAGALQFHQRAVVVGRRTYGKGSVQKIRDFGEGGTLKYTAATYHLPDGRSVYRVEGEEFGASTPMWSWTPRKIGMP